MVHDAMLEFLRAIGLQPVEWLDAVRLTGNPSPYVGEVLDVAFIHAQGVVVLLTRDEITYLRPRFASAPDEPDLRPSWARPNVLFEAGMAMGRQSDRTVLVEFGDTRFLATSPGGTPSGGATTRPPARIWQVASSARAASFAGSVAGRRREAGGHRRHRSRTTFRPARPSDGRKGRANQLPPEQYSAGCWPMTGTATSCAPTTSTTTSPTTAAARSHWSAGRTSGWLR